MHLPLSFVRPSAKSISAILRCRSVLPVSRSTSRTVDAPFIPVRVANAAAWECVRDYGARIYAPSVSLCDERPYTDPIGWYPYLKQFERLPSHCDCRLQILE